ncbi:MAG: hypothetical protein R3330_11840, partial [Saprospiraceae bacterium]|nr:hypothetical protein [Saprospiraceae bacterium]
QEPAFKASTKRYIREVVDRIYSVFTEPPLIAYIVGSELSAGSILATDAAHPDIDRYQGTFITTDTTMTATEAFLAEMADYTKSYESQSYGNTSLVSYATEVRTADILETPFLDFRCHNTYSYAVPYYRPQTTPGSHSGTLFQGYVEEIKSRHPQVPLLISESGLSVSPHAPHIGPPNYGYGGNTEAEQAAGLLQNIEDTGTTLLPTAGICVHEYLDAWWKFGLEDSYSQDPYDIEEWFGIVRLTADQDWYSTVFRSAYEVIRQAWVE